MYRLMAAVLAASAVCAWGQEFHVHKQMIAMRDGVQLATDIYRPAQEGKYPVLVCRTPYGRAGVKGDAEALVKRGYVVLAQDCRGRFESQGSLYGFVNEGPDGYDTIEWAAAQAWSDGQVGTFGASYLAWDQYFAAMYRPPHLVAMFALVGGAKFYDEYAYPGGIPNLGWPLWMLKSAQTSPQAAQHPEDTAQMKELLEKTPAPWLRLAPAARGEMFRNFPDQLQMYSDFLKHPTFDRYWEQKGFYTAGHYEEMKDVPTLFLTGWYDYFSEGVLRNFRELSQRQHTMKRLVVGPWPHGTGAASCGDGWFGDAAAVDQRALMADWFDHWMRRKEFRIVSPMPVQYFRMGGGGGERTAKGKLDHGGEWLTALSWPIANAKATSFFLQADGGLNTSTAGKGAASRFDYDPANPVPTLGGRYGVGGWSLNCAQDGRSDRADVLAFTTGALTSPLDITGRLSARLWITSDARSADFAVKILDVYPDGYALTLADGASRAAIHKSGAPQQVTVDVGSTSNLFAAGHRLRVEIASSNFPKLEPNPNRSHSAVLHDAAHPSALVAPVVFSVNDSDMPVRETAMVAMRDGVKLATDIYLPAHAGQAAGGKFPVLVTRSPYNKNGERRRGEFFAKQGYVFVAQDTRGRYASEGILDPLVREGQDGYDTIEWAAAQPWSNGTVGTTGASYLAMDQYAAAIERPPHLAAMYAAVGSENYYFDAAYRGGIPSLGWPVWILLSAATDPNTSAAVRDRLNAIVNKPDQWLSEPRPQRAAIFEGFPAQRRAHDDFLAHPRFDEYWKQTGFDTADYYARMKDVPVLFVSGWFDSFADATVANYAALSKLQKSEKRLIIGAWPHGYGKSLCGEADFGPADELDENPLQLDWFNHWLKGRPYELIAGDAVRYFNMGGGDRQRNGAGQVTPGGRWVTAQQWPPGPAKSDRRFLRGDNTLSNRPPGAEPPASYAYDPLKPVHSSGARNGPECFVDQKQQRDDVLSFLSEPLRDGENVTGKVTVSLWVGSDAASADFVAKLIDVYPDGYAAPLLEGAQRVAIAGREAQRVTFDLGTTSNLFGRGHRIRLDVTSSSFPKLEPNPQAAHNTIYHDAQHASSLNLPVMAH